MKVNQIGLAIIATALAIFILTSVIFLVPVKPLTKGYESYGLTGSGERETHQLSHVVITLFPSQVENAKANLDLWKVHHPCLDPDNIHPLKHVYKPSVAFFISRRKGEEIDHIRSELTAHYNQLPDLVKACFSRNPPEFISNELTPEEDTHVTGARLMFERLLSMGMGAPSFRNPSFVLLMEPDMRPIRSNWLVKLLLETSWPQSPFWVKGSMYRGPSSLSFNQSYMYHINGNAIYNLHDSGFAKFYFTFVRPWIVLKHGDSLNAYDTDITEYLQAPENFGIVKTVAHMFVYTNTINNLWATEYSMSQYARDNPDTYLVHGGIPST